MTLFSTVPPVWDVSPIGTEVTRGESIDEWVRDLRARLEIALVDEFAGLTVERIADAGDPGWKITEFAHTHDVSLIMMPTHGAGLFRTLLIGSATAKVLHDVRCPVWTAAHRAEARGRVLPRSILCAVDGGEGSGPLMQWASAFSERVGASLTLLHVVEPITDWPSLPREQERQDRYRAQIRENVELIQRSAGVVAPLRVAVGPVVATVAEIARQDGADLTLIGRGVVTEPFGRLRTHAYGIISRSPCPVLSA